MKVLRRTWVRWLGITALASALAIAVVRASWHEVLDNFYYDSWHVLSGVRYVPQHSAFVALDDETLLALKDDPLVFWGPHFGRAIDVLSEVGVKAVGLDLLYQASPEVWLKKLSLPDTELSRTYDSRLRAALARGNVVLITHLLPVRETSELLLPPLEQLALLPHGVDDLGIANLVPDEDKHVRRFYPFFDPDPAKPGTGFAMQLALRAVGEKPNRSQWQIAGQVVKREVAMRTIGFAGPPGTIPTVSMNMLLGPNAALNPAVRALKDKVVIFGSSNSGLPDRHFTPYARGARGDQMAGGEIHANIVETILSGRYPRRLTIVADVASIVLAVAVGVWGFLRFSLSRAVMVGMALLAAAALAGYIAFQQHWVLPVAAVQIAVATAFLLTLGLRFTAEERERVRVRKIFGRYVSDEVVAKLLADDRKPDLAGETLTVTVLFSDIRGFTAISEKLPPHDVVEMLNEYFSRVCEPILANGGTVDKYIGDAVMAVFGSPVQYPDHARRALRAALGMAREAEAFSLWMKGRFAGRGLSHFAIGVGLCTGEAVIGDIGTQQRREFTAIGDTVNAASRLEGVTKELKYVIAAAESTVNAAGPGVQTGKVERVFVKGRTEPIHVYEILGVMDK